jgi:hypothetical protein
LFGFTSLFVHWFVNSSLRTVPSIRFFPSIYFSYFCAFHIYFFSFPYGFTYVALATTVLFILHAMMYFYNVYEIPAFEDGTINAVNPRADRAAHVRDLINSIQYSPTDAARGLNSADLDSNNPPTGVATPDQPSSLYDTDIAVDISPMSGPFSPVPSLAPRSESPISVTLSRNVELSMRIQQEQLSAMCGIPVGNVSEHLVRSPSFESPMQIGVMLADEQREAANSVENETSGSDPIPDDYRDGSNIHGSNALESFVSIGMTWDFGLGWLVRNANPSSEPKQSECSESSTSSEGCLETAHGGSDTRSQVPRIRGPSTADSAEHGTLSAFADSGKMPAISSPGLTHSEISAGSFSASRNAESYGKGLFRPATFASKQAASTASVGRFPFPTRSAAEIRRASSHEDLGALIGRDFSIYGNDLEGEDD